MLKYAYCRCMLSTSYIVLYKLKIFCMLNMQNNWTMTNDDENIHKYATSKIGVALVITDNILRI